MERDETGADPAPGWIHSNQGVATGISVVLVVLLVYLATTDWVYRELRDGFRLGFFPLAAAIAMLVCSLTMLVDRHRREVDADVVRSRWSDWAIAAGSMATCYGYFELAWRVDFLLVTPVFLAAAMFALGVRPLRSAVIAGVVVTVLLYGLFRLIGIELPTEVLGL